MDDRFVRVARQSEIPEKHSKVVAIDGEKIAVWRVHGTLYAINNSCPHQHFSKLNEGTLVGLYVTCPMHGWSFCLKDGRPGFGNGRATVYEVRSEGEDIFVERPVPGW